MTLEVWTARISSSDPDRLDITRKSAELDGVIFAPSWAILRPALAARADAKARRDPSIMEAAWAAYEPAYLAEMRRSYVEHRPAWERLLARQRVVLVCFCTDPARCHRTLLAGIMAKLGADVHGEVV